MIETMEDASGAGLAAPQVHVPLRLFVFRVPRTAASGDADDRPMGTSVLINPSVELVGDDAQAALGGLPLDPRPAGRSAARTGASAMPAWMPRAAGRRARRRASTPASCSTRTTTWTGSCIRCG